MYMSDGLLSGMFLLTMAMLMLPLAATLCRMTVNAAGANGFVAIDMLTP